MSRTIISAALLFAFLDGGCASADPADTSIVEGRSAVEACERNVLVCGVMGPDRLVPFTDRCAAQEAGAKRILVGPCFDEN